MTSAALLTVVFLAAAAPGADAPAGAPPASVAPPIPTASVTPSETSVWCGQRAALVDAISIARVGGRRNAALSCNADNGTDRPGCDKVSFPLLFGASLPILLTAALDDLLIAREWAPAPPSDLSHAWVAPTAGPGSLALSLGGAF